MIRERRKTDLGGSALGLGSLAPPERRIAVSSQPSARPGPGRRWAAGFLPSLRSEVPEAKYRSELAELRSEQHESLRQLEDHRPSRKTRKLGDADL